MICVWSITHLSADHKIYTFIFFEKIWEGTEPVNKANTGTHSRHRNWGMKHFGVTSEAGRQEERRGKERKEPLIVANKSQSCRIRPGTHNSLLCCRSNVTLKISTIIFLAAALPQVFPFEGLTNLSLPHGRTACSVQRSF